jgi:formate hydrogenlyase transcriptional activator
VGYGEQYSSLHAPGIETGAQIGACGTTGKRNPVPGQKQELSASGTNVLHVGSFPWFMILPGSCGAEAVDWSQAMSATFYTYGNESGLMSDAPVQGLDDERPDVTENSEQAGTALSRDSLALESLFENDVRSEPAFDGIVGKSYALRSVLREIETVAPTDSTVLIYGETGTGKELIARAIHELSSRRTRAFVKLNCAAIPTGLLESELFGHERGAFTGAIGQRIGRFEVANHGTAFLDEIGEIPLELQPKLLRVLQEREFERLGSTRTLHTDARLIAATNRDLAAMVEDQRFRSDLFYRLHVFPVRLPSLRERREDIPPLVWHFARHFAGRMKRNYASIAPETMTALCEYDWPGNIRELQNLIERAVILSPGPVLRVPARDLHHRTITVPQSGHSGRHRTLVEAERAHIVGTLKEVRWVVGGPNGAAARLGMNRSTLQFRMKKLGIVRPGREDDAGVASPSRMPVDVQSLAS